MAFVHGTRLVCREAVLSLTPEEKRAAQAIFAEAEQQARSDPQGSEAVLRGLIPLNGPCRWCGGLHKRACNRVERLEWHPNGNLLSATLRGEWDQPGVIWPEDAFDPDIYEEDASGR